MVERSESSIKPDTMVFAMHPHQDRFLCPADDAIVLSDVDPRIATLFPLVETAFQITLDAGDVIDETVIVVGLGAVGMLTALLLQRAGARVVGIEPSPWRRSLAAQLDVDAVGPGDPRVAGEARAPLIVEVSGNPSALASALPLLAHEGTALVASWYGTKPVNLHLGAEFHRRRLTIRSTQVSTIPSRLAGRWTMMRRREHVVRLMGELPLKRLATHEFPFSGAADAFAALDRGDEDLMHAALTYGSR
jgi:2-desacetyl-2-hydroxyethyl bacteriochlorophyllide A dehydrogenase